MRIKIDKADSIFSQYLRKKIGKCEYCGKKESLQVSHFYGRRHENTRFNEENCDILCFSCHNKFHERPADYVLWKQRKLRDKRFQNLMIAANTYKKKDRKLMYLVYKKLLEEL